MRDSDRIDPERIDLGMASAIPITSLNFEPITLGR